jgi:hypothetical protein
VYSTAKADLVRSIGADRVIDYTCDDIADSEHRYDVILDTGGNRPLQQLRRALTPRGTLVIVGGETDGRWLGGSDRQLRAVMLSPFTGQHLGTLLCSENQADLLALTELIESGQVTPAIDKTYPLSETITAIRHMRDGHARGKVIINISDAKAIAETPREAKQLGPSATRPTWLIRGARLREGTRPSARTDQPEGQWHLPRGTRPAPSSWLRPCMTCAGPAAGTHSSRCASVERRA